MDRLFIRPNIRGGGNNPAGMEFTILNSVSWEREMLFDPSNTTYECTRIRGNLLLAYGPGAASFKSQGGGNPRAIPRAQRGEMPVNTDVAIRRFLEQPRFQFEVESSGVVWLTSPADGPNGPLLADVRNGPFLKVESISQIAGERFWTIHAQIETYINEFPKLSNTSLPPLIISNRWYVHEDVDINCLRTRTYKGVCTVRGDVLQAQPLAGGGAPRYIDYFRQNFASFNVPIGHQRTEVSVQITPDGNTAHYSVTDTEQMFDKGTGNPAVRLEVMETTDTVLTAANRAIAQGFSLQNRVLYPGEANEGRRSFLEGQAIMALTKAYRSILIRAWGNKVTPRNVLMGYAVAVAYARMGTVTSIFDPTLSEMQVIGDLHNFVQVLYTLSYGPDATQEIFGNLPGGGLQIIANNLGLIVPPQAVQFDRAISATATINTNNPRSTVSQTPGTNPTFFQNGTRGTYFTYANRGQALYYLVTQALEQFDGAPAEVDDFTA